MKKIFTLIMLVLTTVAYAQDINFKHPDGKFSNQMNLNELRSIQHSTDENGEPIVTAESRNGAIYTTHVDSFKMTTTTVDDILLTERFVSMQRVKSFEKIDELELGDFVGIFNEEDYTITSFINTAYSIMNGLDPTGTMVGLLTKADSLYAAILALKNKTSLSNIRIHVSDIVYVGENMNGQKIPLSARLIYPYDVTNNNLKLSNIYLDNHVTVFQKGVEPTAYYSGFTPCGVVARGYLVAQPDLLGFGASGDQTQLYVDALLNGSAIAYCAVAAQQFAEWSQSRDKYGFELEKNATIINEGASQGASSAMSGTYFIENKLDKEKYHLLPLSETRVCAGAYNMKLCMDDYCAADTIIYPSKVPLLMAGTLAQHPQVFGEYTVHDYFAPEAKTYEYTVTDTTTGETINYGNIWQIFDLKQCSSSIMELALLPLFHSDKNPSFVSMHKLLAADCFNEDGTLDWSNPKLITLKNFFDQNNFASKDLWTPQSPIYLIHANNDDIIPYSTAQEFYNNQNTKTWLGKDNVTLSTLNGVPSLGMGSYGVHMVTCFEFILSQVTGLPASAVNEILKKLIAK